MLACLCVNCTHDSSPYENAGLASVFNMCLHIFACLAINDGLNTRFVIPSILTKYAIFVNANSLLLRWTCVSVFSFAISLQLDCPACRTAAELVFKPCWWWRFASPPTVQFACLCYIFCLYKQTLSKMLDLSRSQFFHFNPKCTCFVSHTCTKRLVALQSDSAGMPWCVIYWRHPPFVLVTTANGAMFRLPAHN